MTLRDALMVAWLGSCLSGVSSAEMTLNTPQKAAPNSLAGRNLAADLDRKIDDLSNVVAEESIARFVGRGKQARKLDQFQAVVEIADGVERYAELRRGSERFSNATAVDGLWSHGELATVLRVVRDGLPQVETEFEDGEEFLSVHIAAGSRRWFLKVDNEIHWLDFDCRIFAEPATGGISRIQWVSEPLAGRTGIGTVTWDIRFSPRDIGGKIYNVPESALYRITRNGRGDRAEWNVTTFSGYARYGSEVTVQFALE